MGALKECNLCTTLWAIKEANFLGYLYWKICLSLFVINGDEYLKEEYIKNENKKTSYDIFAHYSELISHNISFIHVLYVMEFSKKTP